MEKRLNTKNHSHRLNFSPVRLDSYIAGKDQKGQDDLVSKYNVVGRTAMDKAQTESGGSVRGRGGQCISIERPSRLGRLALSVTGLRGRYHAADVMAVPMKEFSRAEYPEDPANHSEHHGKYSGRRLVLKRNDETHFDFIFEPKYRHIAKVMFRDIDVSLMTPSLPVWTRDDRGLRRLALTDRQWNRQQVSFEPDSPHIEVSGGDGFERENIYSAELAKNCLNAGLWEVLLFNQEQGKKALYYQGWFRFPLGHYRRIFEHQTCLSYPQHFLYLEHWVNPEGTPVSLDRLREVRRERDVPTAVDPSEAILAVGEQFRKRRTLLANNIRVWNDLYEGNNVRFAAFTKPGRYDVRKPWKNKLWRFRRFERGILREVTCPETTHPLQELELVFSNSAGSEKSRFFVSGFDISALPAVPGEDYFKGLYMPMGIGIPPFFQSYEDLQNHPPDKSPFFSVLLDSEGRWLDHHHIAVDGSIMHRDALDPNLLHVYLLSYERHTLTGHFVISIRD